MVRSSLRWPSWAVLSFLGLMLTAVAAGLVWAADPPNIVRIEEDWELVIGAPSPNSDAPQVTCFIAPTGDAKALHSTFIVNLHDLPAFVAGGLQLQAWIGETSLASKRYPDQAVLNTPGEKITWTQAMEVKPDGLIFEVISGSSTTWQAFGGEGTLKLIVPTTLSNLNSYSTEVTVENSGVSYAANRVQSLVLKRVRAYGPDGQMVEDASAHVVHSLSQ